MSRVNEAMRRTSPTADADREPRYPPTAQLDRFGTEIPAGGELNAPHRVTRPPIAPIAPVAPVAPVAVPVAPRTETAIRPLEASPAATNPKLILNPHMAPVSSIQYRRLAASLHDLQQERELKIVMVSSAVPQEGKTLTIANLALTLSESYHRRTLLIDADLRRPGIHEIFGLSKTPGLADVLTTQTTQLPIVQASPWLSVLTAGHPVATPLAQLTSERLRAIVTDAAAHFDWVLIDTPPISLMPDAQHVASVSDGVLLVIAAGATPFSLVQRAIAAIGEERILGTALNYVEDRFLHQRELYGRYFAAGDTQD
jgi:capsular exopolysaccharide synthesis family protein